MPTYKPGTEPPKIKKRLDNLFQKFSAEYPTGEIVGLSAKHKKWAETVSELRKILEYPDNATFLAAYGYHVGAGSTGGRPSNNTEKIIDELRGKRPDGKPYRDMTHLCEMNPDLSGKIKTLMNNANKLFGKRLSEYFLDIGLISNARVTSEEQAHKRVEASEQRTLILKALGERYPKGSSLPSSFKQLCDSNPDLPIHHAYENGAFPTPVKVFFIEMGFIEDLSEVRQKRLDKVNQAFATLSQRYKNRSFNELEDITKDNPDLANILSQDSEERKMLISKLRRANIIGKAKPQIVHETPPLTGLQNGEYCFCKVAVEGVRRHYAYICKIEGIHVGDYVQVPFGGDNDLTPAIVTDILVCTKATAPYPPQLTKTVFSRLSADETTMRTITMPRDIALIENLLESKQIIRAGIASGSYYFIYETICPVCGKHKLVYSHTMSWHLHHISVFEKDDGKKRTEAIQKYLDKYGIPVRLEPALEAKFTMLQNTCFCDLKKPQMESIWGGADKILSIDRRDGIVMMGIEAEADINPLSDSIDSAMMDRIEALSQGDYLQIKDHSYDDRNGGYIELRNGDDEPVGFLSQHLGDEILTGIEKKWFAVGDVRVSGIFSRKDRAFNAKKAKLNITLALVPVDKDRPLNWLIRNRLDYLCRKTSNLSIYEIGTNVRQLSDHDLSKEHIEEHLEGVDYFYVDTFLQGSAYGYCRTVAESLLQGAPLFLERKGTIQDGDARFAVCDEYHKKVGWLGNNLASTIAILVDTGFAQIHKITFLERLKKEPPYRREYETFTKVRILVSINCASSPEVSPFACSTDAYNGRYPNASEEYRRFVATLELKYSDEWFLISDDGTLFKGSICEKCNGTKMGEGYGDFGFNTDDGLFSIWRDIPEDDVFDMLINDGISINMDKHIFDWCCCDQEEDDDT